MDMQRAKDVVAAEEFIEVTYNGTSVYINRLFESAPFAEVRYDNGAVTNVPVEELVERRSPATSHSNV